MNEKQIVECLGAIRVQMNWKRAFSEGWPIAIQSNQSKEILPSLYVPWYRDENGREVSYDYPGAITTTVGQVVDTLGAWPKPRQDGIYQYASAYRVSRSAEVYIPVYALPNGNHLILDGNHRAVALSIAQVPFQIHLVVIKGPCDADALPDLAHWQ